MAAASVDAVEEALRHNLMPLESPPQSLVRLGLTKGDMAARVSVFDGCLASLVVAMHPLHHCLRVSLGGSTDLRGTLALGDFVEGQQTLAATGMRCAQGLLSQPLWALLPTAAIDFKSNRSILSCWRSTIG